MMAKILMIYYGLTHIQSGSLLWATITFYMHRLLANIHAADSAALINNTDYMHVDLFIKT